MSTAGGATDWFVMRCNQQSGPFSLMVLWELAGAGRLTKDDWVLQAGSDVWVPVTRVVELPSATLQSSVQLGAHSSDRQASQSSVQLGAHSSDRQASQSSVQLGAHSSARLASQSSARLAAQSSARLASQSSARLASQSSARLAPARRAVAPAPAPAGCATIQCPWCRAQCRIPQPKEPTVHRCPSCARMFRAVLTTVGVMARAVDQALNPTVAATAQTNMR